MSTRHLSYVETGRARPSSDMILRLTEYLDVPLRYRNEVLMAGPATSRPGMTTASRAWCWRRLAESLPDGDPRIGPALGAVRRHTAAALPYVIGDDCMVEHWLAAYAVLLLS